MIALPHQNVRWECAKGTLELEARYRPLFLTTLTGEVDDETYAEYLRCSTGVFFNLPCRQVLVFDATRAQGVSASQRRKQGEWLRQQAPLISRFTLGIAFAFSSPLQRGMLTAVHWIAPPRYQHVVVATREAGVQWALRVLREAGIDVPLPPRV